MTLSRSHSHDTLERQEIDALPALYRLAPQCPKCLAHLTVPDPLAWPLIEWPAEDGPKLATPIEVRCWCGALVRARFYRAEPSEA